MNKFIFILLFIFTLPLFSYRNSVDPENEKYLNFIAAIENRSTFSYFTVIKAKDLNSGITKEICTKGNFVSGALHTELNAGYDDKGSQSVLEFAKLKCNRYFEFKNIKALKNISFFDYDSSLFSQIQTEYKFETIVKEIKNNKHYSIRLSDDKMKAFSHVLFNMGYMTGENDCVGGTLKYVDREKR